MNSYVYICINSCVYACWIEGGGRPPGRPKDTQGVRKYICMYYVQFHMFAYAWIGMYGLWTHVWDYGSIHVLPALVGLILLEAAA